METSQTLHGARSLIFVNRHKTNSSLHSVLLFVISIHFSLPRAHYLLYSLALNIFELIQVYMTKSASISIAASRIRALHYNCGTINAIFIITRALGTPDDKRSNIEGIGLKRTKRFCE